MKLKYSTAAGDFYLVPEPFNGQTWWAIYFGREFLGRYATPFVAAEQVATGGCNWPLSIDPERLDISSNPYEWERID